jgi:hypothetical protein
MLYFEFLRVCVLGINGGFEGGEAEEVAECLLNILVFNGFVKKELWYLDFFC